MRLLAVRLLNLNSLSGAHEVRFDVPPLSQAGVFLIAGPTGAGKSTLLDAMTLALYGRAARYGNDKADEMMSRHTAECMAEVEFETGGHKLRATWRLRRARGKAEGKLQPVERRLADATTGEILAEKAGEIDRLIEERTGLDAQRFLRSVLLAQGQFATFLKAKPNERAELLEKITGTEIYSDLSMLAFETHKAKDEAATRLKERIGAVTVLDDESRTALVSSLAEARAMALQLNTASQAATQHLHAQREHAAIVAEIAKLKAASQQFDQSLVEIAAEVTKAKTVVEEAKQQRTQREPVWEQAAGMAAQSDQFEKQLVDSRTMYQTWATEQKDAAKRHEAAEKALATHIEAAQVLEAWLQQNAADAELADTLPKLRTAVRDWRAASLALGEGRRLHAEAEALHKRLTESEHNVQTLSVALKTCDDSLLTLRTAQDHAAQMYEAQWRVADEARRVADFDEHRHELKEGEACPLCGAFDHPFAKAEVTFQTQFQTARKLMEDLEQQRTKLNRDVATAAQERVRIEEKLRNENTRLAETQKLITATKAPDEAQLTALTTNEASKRSAVVFADAKPSPTPDDAEHHLSALEKRAQAFAKKRDEAHEKRGERQKIENDIQLAKQEEAAKSKRLDELRAEGVVLRGKADALNAALTELLGGRSLAEDRQHHETCVTSAKKTWQEAETRRNALHTQLTATKAKLEQLEARRDPFDGQDVLSAEALNELDAKAKQLNDAFATKHTEVGSLDQQVKNDDAARQRRETGGVELQAAEAEALRWGRLKELIGSADGAKFARFAQSLTLRQLIGLANHHLQVLAPRYRLMAANGDELDLRIVDLYQAAVERPMESLSGGESFLASLALALGLSELASRHHPIDSLFIDEGFGTLDSDTLEVALSALENLRSQGKTIGLISHVDLLKERLATQVRVIRGAGGTSRIEVVA